MSTETTQLTDGQRAIRVQFNANQDPHVAEVKNLYAKLHDILGEQQRRMLSTEGKSDKWKGETAREFALAKTALEDSSMRAVKGLTAHFQD